MDRISNIQSTPGKSQTNKRADRITRLDQLKPVVWREIEHQFSDADYFTRDHLLYFRSMRQFSMSYRISLVREIINFYAHTNKLIQYSITDFAINNQKNGKRLKTIQQTKEIAYSGSYTTRAADELLVKSTSAKPFDIKWLANWLTCLSHLSASTKTYYTRRIVDDLIRRGVLLKRTNSTFSVNHN